MNAQTVAAVRTGAQFLVSWIVAHVTIFAALPEAAQNYIVETIVTAVTVTLWTLAVRYLETRTGQAPLAIAARGLARVLMLGLGGVQPVYAPARADHAPELVVFRDGASRRALHE